MRDTWDTSALFFFKIARKYRNKGYIEKEYLTPVPRVPCVPNWRIL